MSVSSLFTLLQTTQMMVQSTVVPFFNPANPLPRNNPVNPGGAPLIQTPVTSIPSMQMPIINPMQVLLGNGAGTLTGGTTMGGVMLPGMMLPSMMGATTVLPPLQTQPQATNGNQGTVNLQTPNSAIKVGDSPTVNSGPNAGNVLDGKGDSFLDPNEILTISDNFSGSISPPNGGPTQEPFGANPQAPDILDVTNQTLNDILKGRVQIPQTPITLVPGPFVVPVPNLNQNPSPTQLIQGLQFFVENLLNSRPTGNSNARG